jgi:hypothetical protein
MNRQAGDVAVVPHHDFAGMKPGANRDPNTRQLAMESAGARDRVGGAPERDQ